ncbi:MAG: putative oxidoreductase [Pelosinus sp.]|nr:putative oxidoreductase [Pelosinus sp.]
MIIINYTDKTILITGGAKGIGKAMVLRYCEKGATVIFCDIDHHAGKEFESFLQSQQLKGYYYEIDLENVPAIKEMFQYLIETYTKVDILINNAAVFSHQAIEEITESHWNHVININLRAPFFCCKEFILQHSNKEYGRIINIASTRHLMSEANTEPYSVSKGAIVSLTHALAISCSNKNIIINSISPGWIENNNYDALTEGDHSQHPSGRVGKPEDIARACLFLTDENNDFINGENLVIDGGMTKKMIYQP